MNRISLISFLKTKDMGWVLLLGLFVFLKWKSLYDLPWSDENFYPHIIERKWSFFLPWNYRPEYFMGHPAGQPFALWSAFKLFGMTVWTAKATALSFSLLCLFSVYKMTSALFQDKQIAFLSTAFIMSIPLFWFQSTIVLAQIPLMAFGFGSVYAFLSKKYKTLLFFSLGLAVVRESALAFLLPLAFYGLFNSAYRKAFYCIIPSLSLFLSHFLILFIRTGRWFSHPHAMGELPHNSNLEWFNFSVFFERSNYFFKTFFYQAPYWFWVIFLLSFCFLVFSKLKQKSFAPNLKHLLNPNRKIFICLFICVFYFLLAILNIHSEIFSLFVLFFIL